MNCLPVCSGVHLMHVPPVPDWGGGSLDSPKQHILFVAGVGTSNSIGIWMHKAAHFAVRTDRSLLTPKTWCWTQWFF